MWNRTLREFIILTPYFHSQEGVVEIPKAVTSSMVSIWNILGV